MHSYYFSNNYNSWILAQIMKIQIIKTEMNKIETSNYILPIPAGNEGGIWVTLCWMPCHIHPHSTHIPPPLPVGMAPKVVSKNENKIYTCGLFLLCYYIFHEKGLEIVLLSN